MAQPVEIFKNVKGMTRDFAVDSLPDGYLWDLVDAIPNRKGARVEQRGGWEYTGGFNFVNTIMGGFHASFLKGQKLLVAANSRIYDVHLPNGLLVDNIGAGHAKMVQNGVKLNDRVYFFDGDGMAVPKVVTWDGSASVPVNDLPASAPHAKVGIAYKGRLIVGGVKETPQNLYWSRLEDDNADVVGGPVGPLAPWDAESMSGTNEEVTGLAPMAGQVLVFHPSSIERMRGTVPPGTDIDPEAVDLIFDTLTEQVGCSQPHTIVSWRENIIFADERGVFLTDGSVIRNLVELGGIGDFWRMAYGYKIPGSGAVSCGTFLNYLIVTINCLTPPSIETNFTLICDLNTRAWFRFRNFPATCYIPSEGAMEQTWVGHLTTNKLSRVSTMFQDVLGGATPPPDYVDGNGLPVLSEITTGFHRLDKEEGMTRVRQLFISYHHQTFFARPKGDSMSVEYRTDPPTPEDIDMTTGSVIGWTNAGSLPDVDEYSRKKIPVGRRSYGIMVRLKDLKPSRITRIYDIGVERTSQDRAKVTT